MTAGEPPIRFRTFLLIPVFLGRISCSPALVLTCSTRIKGIAQSAIPFILVGVTGFEPTAAPVRCVFEPTAAWPCRAVGFVVDYAPGQWRRLSGSPAASAVRRTLARKDGFREAHIEEARCRLLRQ